MASPIVRTDARPLVRKNVTMEIQLTHMREVRFRFWLAGHIGASAVIIGRLASWVAGIDCNVIEVDQ